MVHVFRGNSPYDPDATGFGVQPYGYDQMSNLYSTINVLASAIKVTANVIPGETFGTKVTCLIAPSRFDTSLAYQDLSDLRANGNYRMSIFSHEQGLTRKNIVRNYMSTRRLYPDYTPKLQNFSTTFGGNPTNQWYWLVFFDTSTFLDEVQVAFDVEITYYMILNRENAINES